MFKFFILCFFISFSTYAQNWVDFDQFKQSNLDSLKWRVSTAGSNANVSLDSNSLKFSGSGTDDPYSLVTVNWENIDSRVFSGIRADLKLSSSSSNYALNFLSIVLGKYYVEIAIEKKSDGSVAIIYAIEEDKTAIVVSYGEQSADLDQYYDLGITYSADQINFLVSGQVVQTYNANGLIPYNAQIGAEYEHPSNSFGQYIAYADNVRLYQGDAGTAYLYDNFWGSQGTPNLSRWTLSQSNGGQQASVNNGIVTLSGSGATGFPTSNMQFNQNLSTAKGVSADILLDSTSSVDAAAGFWIDTTVDGTLYTILWEIKKTTSNKYEYIFEIRDANWTRIFGETYSGASPNVYTHLAVDFIQGSSLEIKLYANDQLMKTYDFGNYTNFSIGGTWIEAFYEPSGFGNFLARVTSAYINLSGISQYPLFLASSANGSISPADTVTNVTTSADQTYTITPDSGYLISSIKTSSGSQIITDFEGMDFTFSNVEKIDNLDVTFIEGTPQQLSDISAFVTRFYEEVLNRSPDSTGLADWTAQLLNQTQAGADIARGFINSAEFQNRNLNDSDFLDTLYLAFFDRPADSGGKSNWESAIDNGTTRAEVLEGFIGSLEFANLTNSYGILAKHPVEEFVTRFYQQCLNREPDLGGLTDWVAQLKAQTRGGADIAVGFIFSAEFISRNLNDEDFLYVLYRAFFNREPDLGGYNNWYNQLQNGATRLSVLNGFLDALEFANLCSEYGIVPRL